MKISILLFVISTISITNKIYAQVGINTSMPNSKSELDIIAKNNHVGFLFPRLTETQINNNINPSTTEDGLIVYNTDTKCLNYWQSAKIQWESICGTIPPSIFFVSNCTGGPSGTYTNSVPLTTANTYVVNVNVSQIGDYTIIGTTGNNYIFSKSGTFTALGIQSVTLIGSGTPTSAGTDTISLIFNDISAAAPSCGTLPNITVL